MTKLSETVLEIDLSALKHNYHFLRAKLSPTTKFMGIVKAFGYGSDPLIIAKRLETLKIDALAVAYVSEGVSLRKAGIKLPILVLHPQLANFDLLMEHCLEPSIYSARVLRSFHQAALNAGQKEYPVHLKFNTGLNRLGFRENDVAHIAKELKGSEVLKIKGIFSHLAASEDAAEKVFTRGQIEAFEKIVKKVEAALGPVEIKHLLNTSGILNYPEAQWDMVRSGIGLYGYGNDPTIDPLLKPVVSLKTIISQIHTIEPNESVGYNRAYRSKGYRTTATLPLGHADGIGRQYGNGRASVIVNGKKAPIIGNVCMDMLMVDISGIDCKEGDEVIIFGKGQSAEAFAAYAQTISYELITGISSRVKRVFK
ncbi:alanine racemase [Muriicola sp.]|uniref:alanine racemase n=1 Tax=Muriicola sp. TaxID=2020856 RepID=UPI003C73146C